MDPAGESHPEGKSWVDSLKNIGHDEKLHFK